MLSPLKPEKLNNNNGKQNMKNKNIFIFKLCNKLTKINIIKSHIKFKKIVLYSITPNNLFLKL